MKQQSRQSSWADVIGGLAMLVMWWGGVAIAKGFWWKAVSLLVPPFGMYVFIVRILEMWGVVE